MNVRKIIQERIRGAIGGAKVDGDVNAVVAANVGERGAVTKVSSSSRAQATSTTRSPDWDPAR
jgi:hypothetical protein